MILLLFYLIFFFSWKLLLFFHVPGCSGMPRVLSTPLFMFHHRYSNRHHKILHAWLVKQSKNTSFLERLSCILHAFAKGYQGYKSNFGFVFAERNTPTISSKWVKRTSKYRMTSRSDWASDEVSRLTCFARMDLGHIINSRGKRMIVIMLCRERREILLTLLLVNCHDLTSSIFD